MKQLFQIIFVFIISSIYGLAQNVGINNANPKAALDVAGDFILQSATLSIGDGNTLDLDVNTNKYNHYKLVGPTGNFQIGGIAAAEHDRIITLYNRSGHSLEVYNEDVTALEVNKILTGTGGTFAVYNGGSVSLKYDSAIGKWEIISSHYNSLDNFGSGNWILNANDIYNGNTGNVGIGSISPQSKFVIDGDIALISDTVYAHCAVSMNTTLNIDNAVKRKSVFHIIEDPACVSLPPSIKTITGGNDGEVIHLFTHINNTYISHLGNPNGGFPPMPPTAADSLNMIELYEPTAYGAANQPSQLALNAGGSISLIYDGTRKRWKPLSYYGENKIETGIWYKGGNPNHMYAGSDKVGIGIGSPTEKLHVNGNVAINGEIKPNGVSGLNGQVLQSDGAGSMVWGTNINSWPAQGNDIKNGNTGNVGIGAFPAAGIKFDVTGNGSFYGPIPFTDLTYNNSALSLYTRNAFPSTAYRYLKLDGQRIQSAGASNIGVVETVKDIYLNPLGGNVGINTTSNITSPLSFPNVLGNKISFWSSGANNEYGIGLQTGKLQIYTAGQDQIAFGWGGSNIFNQTMTFYPGSAQLGINCLPLPNYHLAVNGSIKSKEVVVETANWPDYVFSKDYTLTSLPSIEKYIKEYGHLPNIPSAKEVEENGQALGDTQKRMLEKIEELTLHLIQQQKEIETLRDLIKNKN